MTNLDSGIHGAKRQTWDEDDPRPAVIRLLSENPHADEHMSFEAFWSQMQDDPAGLKSMARYWFHNTWLALQPRPRPVVRDNTAVRAATEAASHQLKARVQHEAKLILLELIMPNNKPLGQCTRVDCRRFGGWFTQLAVQIPGSKTVAEVFSESELRALWKQTRHE